MSPKKRQARGGKDEDAAPGFSFLGFPVRGVDRATLTRHLLALGGLSLLVKVATLIATVWIFHSFIDLFDIGYYLKFALKVYEGQVPYADFTVDYPQLAFVSILLPLAPALLAKSADLYVLSHQALMALFDLGTVMLVYLVALKLWDARRAFTAGVLYATAFSTAYFVLTKYDAYPTFFLMLSVALFVYGREAAGYVAGTLGLLVKWFPALALPYYLIHDLREGRAQDEILRRIGICAAIFLAVTLPFLLLSPSGFLRTYTVNTGFNLLAHSFMYYLDFITGTLFSVRFFGEISVLLTVVLQIILLILAYRHPSREIRTLCGFIFLSVLALILTNKIASPQYFAWVTPFLAIFLAGSLQEWALFYLAQAWTYLEFPLLYNVLYNNIIGYGDPAQGFPLVAFTFFTVKFLIFLALAWVVARRSGILPAAAGPKP
ncbi:MAG: hypothetical protein LUO87_01625 [Methanomicrobiales archaeon]|nr:hypothetical protein [Methanomicrobiales archaeon]